MSEINFSKLPVEMALISYSLTPYLLTYSRFAFMFTRFTLITVLLFGRSLILTFQSPATEEGLMTLLGPGSTVFSITIQADGLMSLPLLSSNVHVKADLSEIISPLLRSISFIDNPFCAKKSISLSQTWSLDLSETISKGLSEYEPLRGVILNAHPVNSKVAAIVAGNNNFNLLAELNFRLMR